MAATHGQQSDRGQRSGPLTPRSCSLSSYAHSGHSSSLASAAGTRLESAPLRPAMMEPTPGKKMLMMSISRPQLLVSIPGTSCPLRIPRASVGGSVSQQAACGARKGRNVGKWNEGRCARRGPSPLFPPNAHVMSLMTSLHGLDMGYSCCVHELGTNLEQKTSAKCRSAARGTRSSS